MPLGRSNMATQSAKEEPMSTWKGHGNPTPPEKKATPCQALEIKASQLKHSFPPQHHQCARPRPRTRPRPRPRSLSRRCRSPTHVAAAGGAPAAPYSLVSLRQSGENSAVTVRFHTVSTCMSFRVFVCATVHVLITWRFN